MNKKVTIEIDFESQSLNVSMNEARGSVMDEIFAVKPLGKTAYTIVRYENVAWIEAENNYSHLHMADGTRITVAKNIGAIEAFLRESCGGFMRISRSEIVNVRMLAQYEGHKLKLSRHKGELTATGKFREEYYKLLASIHVLK